MLKHCSTKIKIGFVRYEQSSQCKNMRDSSVSYASAAAKVDASGEEEKQDWASYGLFDIAAKNLGATCVIGFP